MNKKTKSSYCFTCLDCGHEFDYDEGVKTFMRSEWIQCPMCKGTNTKDNYPEELKS